MIDEILGLNGSNFSGATQIDIQLVTLLLVSNVSQLFLGAKARKILITIIACKIHST